MLEASSTSKTCALTREVAEVGRTCADEGMQPFTLGCLNCLKETGTWNCINCGDKWNGESKGGDEGDPIGCFLDEDGTYRFNNKPGPVTVHRQQVCEG